MDIAADDGRVFAGCRDSRASTVEGCCGQHGRHEHKRSVVSGRKKRAFKDRGSKSSGLLFSRQLPLAMVSKPYRCLNMNYRKEQ